MINVHKTISQILILPRTRSVYMNKDKTKKKKLSDNKWIFMI